MKSSSLISHYLGIFCPPLLNVGSVSRRKQASSTRWKPQPQWRVCIRPRFSSLHPKMFNYSRKTDPHGKRWVGAAPSHPLGSGAKLRGPHAPRERRELRSPFPASTFGLVIRKTQLDKPSLASLFISSSFSPSSLKNLHQTLQNNSILILKSVRGN